MPAIPKQRMSRLPYLAALWQGGPKDEDAFLDAARRLLGGDGLHLVPLGRARTGLHLLTKYAVRDGRRKVVISPCTIPDAINMITLAGGEPVVVDYAPRSTAVDLDHLRDLLTPDVACVILTHYHVVQAGFAAVKALCASRGIPLYEDCAIVFGGSVDGAPIGGQSDASVFSFSAFKFLNFFWGGLISTRDEALARWLKAEVAGWPRLTYRDYVGHSRNVSVYYVATKPLVFRWFTFPRLQRQARASDTAVELPYLRVEHKELDRTLTTRPSLAAFAQWRRKLRPVLAQIEHRRAIAALYRRRLGDRMIGADTPEAVLAGSCFVNFPIWVEAGARDAVHRDAMLAGFDLGKSLYPNVHDIAAFAHLPGRSVEARALVASTLYLPTHAGVSVAYATALADTLAALLLRHEGEARPAFLPGVPGVAGAIATDAPLPGGLRPAAPVLASR